MHDFRWPALIENAVMFLPALWLFSAFMSGVWAAVWPVHARVRDTRSRRRVGRGEGFVLTRDS
jgi:hypothetical protein